MGQGRKITVLGIVTNGKNPFDTKGEIRYTLIGEQGGENGES